MSFQEAPFPSRLTRQDSPTQTPESQVRQLLESIRDIRWLVDVTHHDFKDPEVQ